MNGIAHTLAVTVPVARVPAALNPVPNVIVYDVVVFVNIRRVTIVPAGGTVLVYVVVTVGVTFTTLSDANPIAVDPLANVLYPPTITPVVVILRDAVTEPFVDILPFVGVTVKFTVVFIFVAEGDPFRTLDNTG